MRVLTTLLMTLSAVATVRAQTNGGVPVYSGQNYAQHQTQQYQAHPGAVHPQAQQYQQVPRNYYSQGTYSRSAYPPRATYSRSTYPPGYSPARSHYAYPQPSHSYGQNSQNYSGRGPSHYTSQQTQQPVQAQQVQQPQFGAGFGTTYTDRVRQQANPQRIVQPQVQQPRAQQPQFGAGSLFKITGLGIKGVPEPRFGG